MSYEGYVQCICSAGHYAEFDCYEFGFFDHKPVCALCSNEFVWSNSVDQTNGEDYGLIPMEALEEISPEVYETCAHCNHSKLIEATRYRVPTLDETLRLLTFTDSNGIRHSVLTDNR